MSKDEYSLNEADKQLLLKQSIASISNPALLCQIVPENPNFVEIIDCNEHFLKCFELDRMEVIGNSYDFLLQNENVDYISDNYLEYINLIKTVKSLQITEVNVGIPYPKNKTKIDEFKVNFIPSRYKTKNIYCIFSFEKLSNEEYQKHDEVHSVEIIHNLERAVRNERLLREISNIIASESNLKEVANQVVKIICEYLKVDRCIFYDCSNKDSTFFSEYCSKSIPKLSDAGNINDPESPISRYINFQNQLFLEINHLKQTTTIMICNDVSHDPKFQDIKDICDDFKIGAQIVVIMVSNGRIIGGIYVQQSSQRHWLLEESELIEIISSQFTTAIDLSNYTYKLLISNKELMEKSKQLADSLEHEKKLREIQTQFVALVSHEFKTPLQIIDGAREIILRKTKSLGINDDLVTKSLDRLRNAVSRLNNLIMSNLILSKIDMIDGQGIKPEKQKFNVKNLLKDIVDRNLNLSSEKHISIELKIDELPEIYFGDAKLLDHSFTNIITNAIKYSRNNGKVKITGNIKDGKLILIVSDSGIGIPKDDLNKIGQKFFRAKNTLSVSGTGIGIYLTKYFIELHGGSVGIESQMDVGTTVTTSLPVSNTETQSSVDSVEEYLGKYNIKVSNI